MFLDAKIECNSMNSSSFIYKFISLIIIVKQLFLIDKFSKRININIPEELQKIIHFFI